MLYEMIIVALGNDSRKVDSRRFTTDELQMAIADMKNGFFEDALSLAEEIEEVLAQED